MVLRLAPGSRSVLNGPGAFTLVEILIGLMVFATLVGGFTMLLSGSGKAMQMSANSFSAIHLGEKVMIDLLVEAQMNASILDLSEEFPEMLSHDQVIEAQSSYFRFVKDKKAPWRKIQPSIDGGIASDDGCIFTQLKPFHVQVAATRVAPPGGGNWEQDVCMSEIVLNWSEKDGQKRYYQLPTQVPSPTGPRPIDTMILIDENLLQAKIRKLLFPDLEGKTFEEAVGARNANRDLAFNAGKVAVLGQSLIASLSEITREITDLDRKRKELGNKASPELAAVQLRIARRTEVGASLLFNVLLSMLPSITEVDRLGAEGAWNGLDPTPIAHGLQVFRAKAAEVIPWVQRAGEAFGWLLHPGFEISLSAREKDLARGKSLEVHRLLVSLKAAPVEAYQKFVSSQKEAIEGRNPFLERLYLREESFSRNPALLMERFPTLMVNAQTIRDGILPAATQAMEIMRRLPPKEEKK